VTGALLTDQPNFRDLGGHATPVGHVRRGAVYRSGELSRLGDASVAMLGDLGVRTVIDLRSDAEVADRGADRVPAGTEVVRIPVPEADALAELIGERFARGEYGPPDEEVLISVNRSMVAHRRTQFVGVVHVVADTDTPVVVHCTHGKDRAGFASALLLDVLGVDRAGIEADYLASNLHRREENEAQLAAIRTSAEARTGRRADELGLDWMRGLFYVEPRYLAAAFAEIESRYGDSLGFLGEGIQGRALRDRLRNRLIDLRVRVPARSA
jgi:protein-tyrosine phosphatase